MLNQNYLKRNLMNDYIDNVKDVNLNTIYDKEIEEKIEKETEKEIEDESPNPDCIKISEEEMLHPEESDIASSETQVDVHEEETTDTTPGTTSDAVTSNQDIMHGGLNDSSNVYSIIDRANCYNDKSYDILRNDFKLLSDMLIETYAFRWSNSHRIYCVDCFLLPRAFYHVDVGNKMYLYDFVIADNKHDTNSFYRRLKIPDITLSDIQNITKLHPDLKPTFYGIFDCAACCVPDCDVERIENNISYFGLYTLSVFDHKYYINSEFEDTRMIDTLIYFRKCMCMLFWNLLSNPSIPYFDRVVALNETVEFCIGINENWFATCYFVVIEPMLKASDNFIDKYQLKEIFEPLKDFIVPGLYRRLFIKPRRITTTSDLHITDPNDMRGMAVPMEVLLEDKSFDISNYNEFDRRVKEVCERIFTESYITISQEQLEVEFKAEYDLVQRCTNVYTPREYNEEDDEDGWGRPKLIYELDPEYIERVENNYLVYSYDEYDLREKFIEEYKEKLMELHEKIKKLCPERAKYLRNKYKKR